MDTEEILTLRKSFNSVKDRQNKNPIINLEDRKNRLKASRKLCIGNQDILEKTINKLKNNGFSVYLAKESQDAVEIILKEIGEEKLIVKSKSNVTKEIELTKKLEEHNINVIETDIGDRILQTLHLKPSHPTGPITHVSAKNISKGYQAIGINLSDNPEEIVNHVKEEIIKNINNSSIGITGANAITLEEGSIIIIHNEGNIFEVIRRKKHIVITSIDKIYPNIEEAINMIKILTYNATGAIVPSFIEILSGVSKTADIEKKFYKGIHNPHDVIVIILDNKRSEIFKKCKEILYCIGCGDCLIHCPMYNTVGTDYATDNFLGGKGLAYQTLVENNKNNKLELCLSCGHCKENCPLEIDINKIIKNLRSDNMAEEIYYFLKSHAIWVYNNLIIYGKSKKVLSMI